jgi:hypothetical protein
MRIAAIAAITLLVTACVSMREPASQASVSEAWENLGGGLLAKNDDAYGVRCFYLLSGAGTLSCVKVR